MQHTFVCPFFRKSCVWCVPIGGLAGLIGLGGEFRLPVLNAWRRLRCEVGCTAQSDDQLGYPVLRDGRSQRHVSATAILPYLPEVAGLAIGA